MKIETWVLKYLGLRLQLYAGGEEPQDMASPNEKGLTDKPETKFPNDPDLQQLEAEIQKSSKTQQDKEELIKVLEQIKDAKRLLEGVTAGEKILSRSTEILGKVTKIGDPTDAEYNDIIEKLKKYQEQLGILSGSKEKITARITELDKLVKTKLTGRNVLLRQILSGVKEEQFVFDSEQEGRIISLKNGTELQITLPTGENFTNATLGAILPGGVTKIEFDGKQYSRLGTGEFIDQNKSMLTLQDVLGDAKKLKITGNISEGEEKIDWQGIPALVNTTIEEELKKPEYEKYDKEKLRNYLVGQYGEAEFYRDITQKLKTYDEAEIKRQIVEMIQQDLSNIDVSKRFLKISQEEQEKRDKKLAELEQKKQILDQMRAKTEPPITKIEKEVQDLQVKLDTLEQSDKKTPEVRKAIELLKKQIEQKNNEIGEIKKKYGIDKIEAEIKALEGAPEVKAAIEAGYDIIRSNPNTWAQSSPKEVPQILKIINDFFKSVFGIDFLGLNQEQKDSYGSIISGVGATQLGSLSERFESGGRGPTTITPNDAGKGFPSYGTYQLNRELLRKFADSIGIVGGNHLETSDSGEFAQKWKAKIQELGIDKFKEREHAFVKENFFDPQMLKIKGIVPQKNHTNISLTFQNVVWSTAVQHGTGNTIITNVLQQNPNLIDPWNVDTEKQLITKIYEERARRYPATASRYKEELQIALAQVSVMPGKLPSGLMPSVGKDSKGGVPTCSRTAVANAANYGLPGWHLDTARGAENFYRKRGEVQSVLPPSKTGAKYADIYSHSTGYPDYGHRAFAVNHNGRWFVLDPYLKIPLGGGRTRREDPIPWEQYISFLNSCGRPFRGARYLDASGNTIS